MDLQARFSFRADLVFKWISKLESSIFVQISSSSSSIARLHSRLGDQLAREVGEAVVVAAVIKVCAVVPLPLYVNRLAGVHLRDGVEGDGHILTFVLYTRFLKLAAIVVPPFFRAIQPCPTLP